MKIRNGFVSNSSSSSFVVIGVSSSEDNEVKGLKSLYVEDKGYITGIVLTDGEYMDSISISFDKLQEYAKKVSELLEIDISEVKLMAGTRYC